MELPLCKEYGGNAEMKYVSVEDYLSIGCGFWLDVEKWDVACFVDQLLADGWFQKHLRSSGPVIVIYEINFRV